VRAHQQRLAALDLQLLGLGGAGGCAHDELDLVDVSERLNREAVCYNSEDGSARH
jgi:hypothetical protein